MSIDHEEAMRELHAQAVRTEYDQIRVMVGVREGAVFGSVSNAVSALRSALADTRGRLAGATADLIAGKRLLEEWSDIGERLVDAQKELAKAKEEADTKHYWYEEAVSRERKLREAARALYEQVEMDESVGICLSDRTAALTLGQLLGEP